MRPHPFGKLPNKDLMSVADLSTADINRIHDTAAALKAGREEYNDLLAGRKLAMVFEKDSLRTRFTFDVGMQDLGGGAVFMDHRDARIGSRESLKDVARNLERWVHGIVARTFKHRALLELAENCRIPVINGLSDYLHPCQGLTDFFTLREHWDGKLTGRRMTYVGDGNNTCHSLIHTAARLGVHLTICTPEGYEPNSKVVNNAMIAARDSGSEIRITDDPIAGTKGAECIYTDVWASMGQEDEIEERNATFEDFRVDEAMMERGAPGCLFLHCLPAHRGQEVSAGVMDSPNAIVYDNAENRLHIQKAVMTLLMGQSEDGAASTSGGSQA